MLDAIDQYYVIAIKDTDCDIYVPNHSEGISATLEQRLGTDVP